jgi:hypothetical protein
LAVEDDALAGRAPALWRGRKSATGPWRGRAGPRADSHRAHGERNNELRGTSNGKRRRDHKQRTQQVQGKGAPQKCTDHNTEYLV